VDYVANFSFALPVLPGTDPLEIPRRLRARMPEYEESSKHAGVTMDRAFLQPTPMGDFVVLYYEGELDFPAFAEAQLTSGLAIDRDLTEWVKENSGIDFTEPPPGPPPELIAEWADSDVSTRKPGLAFCAPLAPGQTDAARRFAQEAFVNRVNERTASRRAVGVSRESVFLNSTPAGDIVCVYLEGADPAEGNRRFAASQSPYDAWFKAECLKVFAPGIDFNEPLPPIQTIWDWQRAKVTA
jgi:hypothetical protein